jgi:hypothetical protein
MVGTESDDPKVRSSVLDVLSFDLLVDLTGADEAFSSVTELRFRCRREGVGVFADLQAVEVRRVVSNGADVTSGHLKDAAVLRQLEETIGRRALLSGLSALMDRYNHGTISLDDLVQSWSESSGRDLRRWAAQALGPRTE